MLLAPFIYRDDNRQLYLIIPSGFVTDFASVPDSLRNFFPVFKKAGYAALIHDWLYRTKLYSKEYSDNLFYNLLVDCGVGAFSARMYYYAVVLFGQDSWARKKIWAGMASKESEMLDVKHEHCRFNKRVRDSKEESFPSLSSYA